MLIGIDVGSTVLKVAAFDRATGDCLAKATRPIPVDVGPDGRREAQAADIEMALETAFAEVRSRVGPKWPGVAGVGLAAQGGSTIIADRASGRAATPMVMWNDARCAPDMAALLAERPPEHWREFALRDEPGMGLARLRWLRRSRPELLSAEHICIGVGEYLYFGLTGQWLQDACNAGQAGIYDARRDELTPEPLADTRTGVDLSFFAALRRGHSTHPTPAPGGALAGQLGERLAVPVGTPVAGPYNDHEAAFVAVAGASGRPLSASLGTAWVGNFQLQRSRSRSGGSPFQLVIPSPCRADSNLVIQPLLTGNVTWDWALRSFAAPGIAEALAEQDRVFAERLLPPDGLVALPWLNRPNPLAQGTLGAGCLLGLQPSTTHADMLRAVGAGMAYEFARVFEAVVAAGAVDSLVLSGGASRGAHFRRLLGMLLAPLPAFRVVDDDLLGARGSLVAFGGPSSAAPTASMARIARMSPDQPRSDDDCEIRRGYAQYISAFDRIYSQVPAGQPYRIHAEYAEEATT